MNYRIEVEGVHFSYGERAALKDVSASVSTGEFVCLLGPNGAGKSTLARLVVGELSPARGRVYAGSGGDAGEQSELRRHVSYLPQDLQDPPFVSARELVSLGRFRPDRSLGWRVSSDDREIVQNCLARCLVDSLADRPFDQLSGGEKQRVWLSFCLAQQREFLILDESLQKIDYSKKGLFFRMLANLAADGKGVILITHDLQMAERYGERMLVLRNGELAHDGPPGGDIYSLMED